MPPYDKRSLGFPCLIFLDSTVIAAVGSHHATWGCSKLSSPLLFPGHSECKMFQDPDSSWVCASIWTKQKAERQKRNESRGRLQLWLHMSASGSCKGCVIAVPMRGSSSPLCIQKAVADDISSCSPSFQRETSRFWGVWLFVCMWEADKLEARSASLCCTKQATREKHVPLIWPAITIFRLSTIYTGIWKGESLPTPTSQRPGAFAHLSL